MKVKDALFLFACKPVQKPSRSDKDKTRYTNTKLPFLKGEPIHAIANMSSEGDVARRRSAFAGLPARICPLHCRQRSQCWESGGNMRSRATSRLMMMMMMTTMMIVVVEHFLKL